MKDIFLIISNIIRETAVCCVLIGGFAVNYHKVTRQTQDVDFLITEDDFDKIVDRLKKEGFRVEYRSEVFAGLSDTEGYIMDLDFMFVEKDTIDKIVKESETASIGPRKFLVPSVRHLIALKLHAMKYNAKRQYKDLLDIIELVKANKVNVKGSEFRELCLKYGNEELYNKISGVF